MWFDEARAMRLCLSSHGVLVAQPGGWFGRTASSEVHRIDVAPPGGSASGWQAAVEALASWLNAASGTRILRVHLASELVRWLLVPWSSQLASVDELEAYAQLQFRATFGEAADGWRLGLSQPTPGEPLLVCAVDDALLQALQALQDGAGVRLLRVEPYVSAAVDHWRARLGQRAAWVVVAEPGMLTLALIQHGQWRGVRQLRRSGSDPLDLVQLRPAQSQLRSVWDDDTADELPIWVIGGSDAVARGDAGDGVRWLEPAGRLRGLGAQARLAWGV